MCLDPHSTCACCVYLCYHHCALTPWAAPVRRPRWSFALLPAAQSLGSASLSTLTNYTDCSACLALDVVEILACSAVLAGMGSARSPRARATRRYANLLTLESVGRGRPPAGIAAPAMAMLSLRTRIADPGSVSQVPLEWPNRPRTKPPPSAPKLYMNHAFMLGTLTAAFPQFTFADPAVPDGTPDALSHLRGAIVFLDTAMPAPMPYLPGRSAPVCQKHVLRVSITLAGNHEYPDQRRPVVDAPGGAITDGSCDRLPLQVLEPPDGRPVLRVCVHPEALGRTWKRCSLREWSGDVMLWLNVCDMGPQRKASALVVQVRGGAQHVACQIPPTVCINGGVKGQQVDPRPM